MNINTKINWDKYFTIHPVKTALNYPDKFKFISRSLLMGIKKGKILELGCGLGFLLRQIKEDHPDFEIEGFDFSKIAVDTVNSFGITAKEKTIPVDLIMLERENYDVVIATEVLEHLEDDARLETIKEVYRILKKGGKAIFTVPDNILPPSEEKFHLTCYTEETFKEFLGQVFDFIGVSSRRFLVSNNPAPKGQMWGEAPFLFGIGYKT